jgi:MFS family permease
MPSSPAVPFVRDRLTWLAYLMLANMSYVPATLGPMMPFLRSELNLNYTMGGTLIGAMALGMILAGLTGDRIARRWGRRSVFWGGGIGIATCALGLALSRHVALAMLSVMLLGFCGSLTLSMIQAILSDRHGEQRAIALTESNVAASVSASLAPLFVGGLQRADIGWRGAPILAVILFASLAAWFYKVQIPDAPQPVVRPSAGRTSLPSSFWVFWVVAVLVVAAEWCVTIWGADYLKDVVGLSKIVASTTMTLFFVAVVVGRVIGSALTRIRPSKTILLAALLVAMLGFPIFWLARLAALNLAGLFLAGLGIANLYPLTLSVAVGTAPQQSTTASARLSLAVGLAAFVAPFALGWLADQLGLQIAYSIVVVLLLTAAALTFLSSRSPVSRVASSLR